MKTTIKGIKEEPRGHNNMPPKWLKVYKKSGKKS